MTNAPNVAEVVYQLESSDHQVFNISGKALMLSTTLGSLVSNLGLDQQAEEERTPIPLKNVSGETLEMVVRWCEHHKDDAPVADDELGRWSHAVMLEWDEEFFKMNGGQQLFKLISASNYLEIPTLMDLSCRVVANVSVGKSPEELLKIYMISDDEKEEVHPEHPEHQDADKHGDAAGPSHS